MSASTSTSTSALPTLRQALCQLSSPSSLPTSPLSVHWDLNLGPAQLSVHRWTSTAAGPQRADRMPEDMPDRMSDGMPEDMPDKIP